jgi:hypothetical protein
MCDSTLSYISVVQLKLLTNTRPPRLPFRPRPPSRIPPSRYIKEHSNATMPKYPVDRAAFCAEATEKLKRFIGHWQLPEQIQQKLLSNHNWLARNDDGDGGLIISIRMALSFQDFYELHRTLRESNMIVYAVKLSRDLKKEFVELRSYIDWYVACVYTDTWPEDFLQIARNSILELTGTAVEEELIQRIL